MAAISASTPLKAPRRMALSVMVYFADRPTRGELGPIGGSEYNNVFLAVMQMTVIDTAGMDWPKWATISRAEVLAAVERLRHGVDRFLAAHATTATKRGI